MSILAGTVTAGCEAAMRYDREITFLLAEGLKGPERRAAAAELICILLHRSPSAEELDALEAKIAGEAGEAAAAAYRDLRAAIWLSHIRAA